ncbi:ACP S-malonyltransferase [Magnetovibrio blakemorei]|uniref:[acyl-carrier-protein] S-malonyltransferase n=1 Tax=Magnetovibrio blakemorei TaxID=28181 RepID=A0A1E5QAR1_9PROT|nr:ACP S-malonyltransferase [Magnetovibrio blakemorei]OEJ69075.1 [acyl-carrier-protein] S-malonyltransferase [Magnetovibrio blakemorei]
MRAYMFPGQGAQRTGMGEGLFDLFPGLTAQADGVLGYSIRELCLQGPMERLTQTQFTQPALFVVNALSYLKKIDQGAGRPDYLLGHSVAEYVALFAAGVVSFEDGLRLVQKRGALMASAHGGGMAAVLGLSGETVEALIQDHGLSDIFAANYNTPQQIVVSGKREAVEAAEPIFMQAGASLYKVLAVSGAFHTPFMADAKAEFGKFAADISFASPEIPVVSNVTARPHLPETIRKQMVEQITSPVRWSDSIRYLLAKGLAPEDFCEIGPEGAAILKPMVKRTLAEAGPLKAEDLLAEEASRAVSEPSMPTPIRETESVVFGVENLGSRAFCEAFGLRHPYVTGAMYKGIASADLVIRMAGAGMLGFLGAGGLSMEMVESEIQRIRAALSKDAPFGVNFISHLQRPHLEEALTDCLLRNAVKIIEASAFMEVTPALVRYRAKGLSHSGRGVQAANRIIAKVSRPDVAAQFFAPASERLLEKMLLAGQITSDEAELLRQVPMADAVTAESDSGGHTDQGMPFTLIPSILKVRDAAEERFPNFGPLFVGAGGGIGTPEAAAASFVLGADYLVTGSINQCSVEAGTSEAVKDMLAEMNVYDTAYAPSGAMFELGSKVQVLKKGLFFPSRAEKLVNLYHQHESLETIDSKLAQQIQERYFKRSFADILVGLLGGASDEEKERIQRMGKYRMAQTFRCYFNDATRWALSGDMDHKVDFQIHCGPAQGAFNQWVAGSDLQPWRQRHVDVMAQRLLDETASLLSRRVTSMLPRDGRT